MREDRLVLKSAHRCQGLEKQCSGNHIFDLTDTLWWYPAAGSALISCLTEVNWCTRQRDLTIAEDDWISDVCSVTSESDRYE